MESLTKPIIRYVRAGIPDAVLLHLYRQILLPRLIEESQLPNWQYIAAVSGGRLIKGRLPIISHEEQ